MIIIFPTSQYSGLNQMVEDEQIRNVFSKLLIYFDTGIESVESKLGQMEFDKIFEGIPKEDGYSILFLYFMSTMEIESFLLMRLTEAFIRTLPENFLSCFMN